MGGWRGGGGGSKGGAVYLWYDFLSLPVKRLEVGNKGVPFYRHFQRSSKKKKEKKKKKEGRKRKKVRERRSKCNIPSSSQSFKKGFS